MNYCTINTSGSNTYTDESSRMDLKSALYHMIVAGVDEPLSSSGTLLRHSDGFGNWDALITGCSAKQ